MTTTTASRFIVTAHGVELFRRFAVVDTTTAFIVKSGVTLGEARALAALLESNASAAV